MDSDIQKLLNGEQTDGESVNKVTDVPDNLKSWTADNADRIERAKQRGTLPYWYKDNEKTFSGEKFHAARITEENRRKRNIDEYDKLTKKEGYVGIHRDEKTGGTFCVHPERLQAASKSKQERIKFEKEKRMCEVYARNGFGIVMLKETPRGHSCDVLIDGVKGDLKSTKSANNVLKYTKKAIREQGAEVVLLEFTEDTEQVREVIIELRRKGYKGYYYFADGAGKSEEKVIPL